MLHPQQIGNNSSIYFHPQYFCQKSSKPYNLFFISYKYCRCGQIIFDNISSQRPIQKIPFISLLCQKLINFILIDIYRS